MSTNEEPIKGVPRMTGDPEFTPRIDFNEMSDWVLQHVDEFDSTTADLPTTGNWPGRRIYKSLTKRLWMWDGGWRIQTQPWTDFSPTWENPPVLGAGGGILYAKSAMQNGNELVRVGMKFGTGTVSLPDLQLNPPSGFASWFNASVTPIGEVTFIDTSASSNGRFVGTLYNTLSRIRASYGRSPMLPAGVGVPFAIATGDEVHFAASYPHA